MVALISGTIGTTRGSPMKNRRTAFLFGACAQGRHSGYRRPNQPVVCSECETNDCHHGNCGLNCGGRLHAQGNRRHL